MSAEASLKITADNTEFIKAMKESQKAVSEAFESMKGTIESFTGVFEKVNVAMAAFTAVLAGGKAFKEAVGASLEAAMSASKLARELGITATQASVLKVAMDENFVPMEAVEGAANKIAAAIKKNPAEFQRMGVAIRDSNGNMRNSYEIMQDVNEKLAEMQEGTARNVEGQRIYGKSWAEIAPSIKITKEKMEEARITAAELHLTVGKEGVAQTLAYRKAMEGMHATFEGIEKSVGDALVPVLTSMGEWFADIGPTAVNATRAALVVLVAVFEKLKFAGITTWQLVQGASETAREVIIANLSAVAAFLMNPFSGDATAVWDNAMAAIEAKAKARAASIKQAWTDSENAIDKFSERMASPETAVDKKPLKNKVDDDNAGKDQIAALQDVLNQKKIAYEADAAAHGELLTFSYAMEMDYWAKVRNLASTNAETRTAIDRKVAELTLAQNKKNLEGQLAALKTEEEAVGKNLQARLAAQMKYAAAIATIYRDDPKKYQEAQAQILATKQAIIEQQRKIDSIQIQSDRDVQLAAVNNAEAAAKEQYTLKKISLQQLIALERQYQNEKYQLELKAAADELAIVNPNEDPAAYAEKLARIRAIAAENQQQLSAITQKGTQDQLAQTEKLTNALTQGFSTAFQGIIKGTETMHKAMTQVYSAMLNLIVSTLAKILSQTIATHLVEMTQTKEQQAADASAGAVAAGKSAAAIPVVGWSLSLGAMAAFFAAAAGFGAEGGFDIPAGINPVTQLHQKEMVLPAPIADPLRDAISKGQMGGRGANFTMNVKANDAKSFEKQLKANGSLTRALRDMHRRMQR